MLKKFKKGYNLEGCFQGCITFSNKGRIQIEDTVASCTCLAFQYLKTISALLLSVKIFVKVFDRKVLTGIYHFRSSNFRRFGTHLEELLPVVWYLEKRVLF